MRRRMWNRRFEMRWKHGIDNGNQSGPFGNQQWTIAHFKYKMSIVGMELTTVHALMLCMCGCAETLQIWVNCQQARIPALQEAGTTIGETEFSKIMTDLVGETLIKVTQVNNQNGSSNQLALDANKPTPLSGKNAKFKFQEEVRALRGN
jgi:hypothetical protein